MRALLFLLLAALISGCGGGGGGQSTNTLLYTTDWTNRARASGGLSQRITIFDASNRVSKTILADQSATSTQTYPIEGLPNGTYHVQIDLFSGHNAAGVQVGTLDSYVAVSGSTPFATSVGDDIAAVQVSPSAASITVPQSFQFYPVALSSGGKPTFAAPNAFTWQAFGSVASVNATGLATATSAGSGFVRATHASSGKFGSASLGVQAFVPHTGKWTVLVYLNAANDLYTYSKLNVNQMERVAQNPDVRFVVQWKQTATKFPQSTFDGTRRYLVRPDTTEAIGSQLVQDLGTSVDMGLPQTLKSFLDWGKTYYPAQHYALVIWNHGNGWRRTAGHDSKPLAFSYDDQTGHAIQIWELQAALGTHSFDMIAWDASLMQMLEVAYEIRSHTPLVVGSEESPPGEGYPYDTIFAQFRDNPDLSPRTLSKAFVDGMIGVPAYASRKITQSVLDTSKLPALASSCDLLAQQLSANQGTLAATIQAVRSQSQSYSQTSVRTYRDLYDVCDRLQAAAGGVLTACAPVKTAISQAVVWEGHNANSPGSHGVAIDFSQSSVFLGSVTDYKQMKLANDTHWDEWLSFAP